MKRKYATKISDLFLLKNELAKKRMYFYLQTEKGREAVRRAKRKYMKKYMKEYAKKYLQRKKQLAQSVEKTQTNNFQN